MVNSMENMHTNTFDSVVMISLTMIIIKMVMIESDLK